MFSKWASIDKWDLTKGLNKRVLKVLSRICRCQSFIGCSSIATINDRVSIAKFKCRSKTMDSSEYVHVGSELLPFLFIVYKTCASPRWRVCHGVDVVLARRLNWLTPPGSPPI